LLSLIRESLSESITLKVSILVLSLLVLVTASSLVLRKQVRVYSALTWGLVELFWYLISFVAVCAGLVEIERIERMDTYSRQERTLEQDYESKKGLLYAQTMLLKSDKKVNASVAEGQRWFHKMKALFEEGLYTNRWEGFVHYSDCYIFRPPGCYTDVKSNALEYGWPKNPSMKTENIFLRDEIRWVVDSLKHFELRKHRHIRARPEETANYQLRYYLVGLYLLGLSLKILKIYADYRRISARK
jgi:hypothetical protein